MPLGTISIVLPTSDSTIKKMTDAMDRGQLESLRHALQSMVKVMNAATDVTGESQRAIRKQIDKLDHKILLETTKNNSLVLINALLCFASFSNSN